tara:strand:- start:1031 stop:1675 length:645 start_codon:yes stop_codon:yes gene_type:complete
MELKTIRVYGRLRKFLGQSSFKAVAASPADAMRFLLCNFPKLEKHMMDQFYKVKMGESDITEDSLNLRSEDDIQIIPVAVGANDFFDSTLGKIVTGAALIAAPYLAPAVLGAGAAAAGTTLGTIGATIGTAMTSIGVSMAIGGVTQMLTPTPPSNSGASSMGDDDPLAQGSYAFSGITNVSVSGIPVPIIYGEVFTGSIVISSGVDTVQIEGTA